MSETLPRKTCKTSAADFCAYVDAGFTLFPCVGYSKVPARKGFLEFPFDPEFIPDGHNYGVLLRRRYLVIDCDPRAYKDGDKPLTRLLNELKLPTDLFKETFTVKTPRGGYHIYFSKPGSVQIVNVLKDYPGLEFKDHFIMACGSYIDATPKGEVIERGYKPVFGRPADIMRCPQILLAKLLKPDKPKLTLDGPVILNNDADIHAFTQHCLRVEPAVEGKNGDLRTYQVACAGRDFGLSQDKTFDIMFEHFNPRCEPVWDSEGLKLKVQNAYEYSTRTPQGIKSIQNDFSSPIPATGKKEIVVRYQLDGHGAVKKCMANLKLFFELPVIRTEGDTKVKRALTIPPIGNFLRFDQFSHRIIWGKPAPWFKNTNEWSDEDAIEFKHVLSEQLSLDFNVQDIHDVAVICANRRVFHPVRDYLESCAWDGIKRVDSWLCRYCGAADNEYSRFVGRKVLVAAVARVFAPGCKFDHVLVTEGPQGIGKSYMWEILTSPWFTDAPLHIQDKSAVEIMQGKWVIELAEMEALTKYESQTIKGFLTRTEDRCRLAYGKKAKSFPRQNIFVGSLNPEVTGWLKDRTGNRRYWPLAVGKIDLKALKSDKDVLWAEALQIFQQGEIIHIEDDHMKKLMQSEVDSRMQEDPWFGLIEEHLHANAADYIIGDDIVVQPADLYTRCIGGNAATFGLREANRVASVLKILGFEKTKSTVKLGYVYIKKNHETI